MTEFFPNDTDLNALDGTTAASGIPHILKGALNWFLHRFKLAWVLDKMLARTANGLRVYRDADADSPSLTFGVYPGRFLDGAGTVVTYAGSTGNALVDEATNYIYITADGTLTVNQAAFPAQAAVPHIPLATIVCTAGDWSLSGMTDYRDAALWRCGATGAWRGVLAAEPADAVEGDRYFDSTDKVLRIYANAGWIDLAAAATGTMTIAGGVAVGGAAAVTGNATIGGTLGVTGALTAPLPAADPLVANAPYVAAAVAQTQTELTHDYGYADFVVDDVGEVFYPSLLNNNFREITLQLSLIKTDIANLIAAVGTLRVSAGPE